MFASYPSVAMGGAAREVPAFGDSDPLGTANFYLNGYRPQDGLRTGYVITYNPNTHSATVQIHGAQSLWTCIFADEMLSYSYGFSETNPGREGDFVLVYPICPYEQAGIIVGRVPAVWCFQALGDIYNDPDQYHRRAYTQDELEKQTWDRNISAFMLPLGHPHDDSTHIATHFRPTDLYPGEFAHVNQHNCGIKGGLFSATLLGGGAQLRMSGLSNMARLSCETYKRFSMHAHVHEFHNGRYLSSERQLSYYQEERLGWHSPDGGDCSSKVWTYDSEAPTRGENQTARPRIKEFAGFFGHLSSKFCLRPDPADGNVRVQGDTPNDEGVSRETIDPSGQYRISAAGMVAIERTGRIPVPVRICYPTDVGHDIPTTPEVLKPFIHKDDEDPAYRQLELYDRQAYDLKTQYARVDGLGFTPDHYVPQEEELKPLLDEYDPRYFHNVTVKLTKYDKRRAGVYIGEDGSVIIRDAWGSEITMVGGNITFACAGNVLNLPGRTALTMAGDDIVLKAQNSVDVHASEHDVRLSAAKNMEIVGGGDEGMYPGGVIIESKGIGVRPWNGEDKGESANLSGIVLKTRSQGITIDGKRVNIRSKNDTRIISGDEKIDGMISLSAKTLRTRSKDAMFIGGDVEGKGGDVSGVYISKKNVMAVGRSIGLYAEKSLIPIQNSKYPVPLMWVDVDDVYGEIEPAFEEATQDISDEKSASVGFYREMLNKMKFGFRTSDECRTTSPWVIGTSGPIKLYEPAWVQVKDIYEMLKKHGVDTKNYEENASWDNGRPWPGKEAETGGLYSQIVGLRPKNLTDDGFNKSRKLVEDNTPIEDKPLMPNYLIRK